MCDWLSGFVTHAGDVIVRDMLSHSRTAEAAGIRPDSAREFEWTGDDEESLVVRVHEDDPHDCNWYRACVLAHGATRPVFLRWVLAESGFLKWIEAGGSVWLDGLKEIPAGLVLPQSVGGDLWLNGLKEIPAGLVLPQSFGGNLWLDGLAVKDRKLFRDMLLAARKK